MKVKIFFIMVFVTSCLQKDAKIAGRPGDPKYSENELNLIGIDDTMQVLDLNLQQDRDSIINDIEKLLKKDLCEKLTHFGMNLGHRRVVKLSVFKSCGTIHCGLNSYLHIELCKDNKILINYKFYDLNSIPHLVEEHINTEVTNDPYIPVLLNWHPEVDEKRINQVLEYIIDGYLSVYKKLSLNKFHKPLYLLDSIQVKTLKSQLFFKIEIGCNLLNPKDKTINCYEFTRFFNEMLEKKEIRLQK